MPKENPPVEESLDNVSRRLFIENMSWRSVLDAFLGVEAGPRKQPAYLTDSRLEHEDITFESGGRRIEAFVCRPKSDEKRAGVIVVHEIFGLNDHIRDVAGRLAKAGYEAIAVDFYTREGSPPKEYGQALLDFATAVPDRQILDDINSAARYLRNEPGSNGKAGILGFCWGGRLAMLGMARHESLDAGVAYYGRIRSAITANQPQSVLEVAAEIRGPILGHFGGNDPAIPLADVEAMRTELQNLSNASEIHVYDEAGHAFNNDTRPTYHDESARLAWRRTLEWFDRYLR